MSISKLYAFFQSPKIRIKTIIFLAVYAIYFSFSFYHISSFITADEHFWVKSRIPRYWKSIINKDWARTSINDKPGITLAYISGIPALIQQDEFWKHKLDPTTNYEKSGPDYASSLYKSFRMPLVIFNGVFSLFFFWIIKKFTDSDFIALCSGILILLSPILIGISQIVNPDALLWIFFSASFFSFLALLKTEEKKFAVLSSLFLGLSLLTKYTSVILMPFFSIAAIIYYISKAQEWKNSNALSKKITSISSAYLLIIAGSLVVFAALLPAVFVKSGIFYKGTIGYPGIKLLLWPAIAIQLLLIIDAKWFQNRFFMFAISKIGRFWKNFQKLIFALLAISFLAVLFNWISGERLLSLDSLPLSTKQGSIYKMSKMNLGQKIMMEFFPLLFSLTPLMVFSIVYVWTKSVFRNIRHNFLISVISLFIVVFYAALISKGVLATIRYSIVVYPFLSVLAAIGINEFFSAEKFKTLNKNLLIAILIIAGLISLWFSKPFYFNYTNNLLPKKYTITNAWGYGGYEAAMHINSLPNSENFTIWSDYYGVCDFLKTQACFNSKYILEDPSMKIDYFVLTKRGEARFKEFPVYRKNKERERLVDGYKFYDSAEEPEWQILIDNRPGNYIKVFKNIYK